MPAQNRQLGLVAQHPARVAGPVAITIAAGRPDRRKRNLDNVALDLLTAHEPTIRW
jgi:hypothetical protein